MAVICVPTGWTVLAVPCVATTKQNGTSSYWSLTCTHAYIHTHTLIHTRTHTYTYMHTHSYIHAHTLIHTCTHTHTYTHTHSYIHAHSLIHTRTHTHTHTHTHTLFKIHRYTCRTATHTHTHKLTPIQTLINSHTYTHSSTYKDTQGCNTPTQTKFPAFSLRPFAFNIFPVVFFFIFLPQNIIFILLPFLLERYTISYSMQWSGVSFLFTRGNSLKQIPTSPLPALARGGIWFQTVPKGE